MRNYKFPPSVQEWIDIVEGETYKVCKDQKQLVKHVKECFATEDIYMDEEQLEKYLALQKYTTIELFPWQKFVIALHDCTYWTRDGMPRWPDLFCMIGRGAGKDGMIAYESFCLTSPYNGIGGYDVDICANNEDQGVRPVKDLIGWFEQPPSIRKLKRFYHWTQERVTCTRTKSVIKGRTNNPKGKDGLRSGIVILNEIHEYANYDNIDVFTTGLGKKAHPRRSYYSTNGKVREGPLDDLIAQGEGILYAGDDDNGMLPFICRLDDKNEVHAEENWTKANPSLPYLPNLLTETRKEYKDWKKNPERLPAFMAKRMNLPQQSKESAAAKREDIIKTKRELPDMEGWSCVAGIDYALVRDWVAVNLHFKRGEERLDINHSWICSASADLPRIKAPWRKWVEDGLITYVDDVEISPDTVAGYIYEMGSKYMIEKVALDNYRYSLMKEALNKIGFSKEMQNIHLVSQLEIMKIVPVIDHYFTSGAFVWGDNPVLRWACNNTKTVRYGRNQGTDKGSYVYAKIEARSRKTDPFMALVACIVVEDEIKEYTPLDEGCILTI